MPCLLLLFLSFAWFLAFSLSLPPPLSLLYLSLFFSFISLFLSFFPLSDTLSLYISLYLCLTYALPRPLSPFQGTAKGAPRGPGLVRSCTQNPQLEARLSHAFHSKGLTHAKLSYEVPHLRDPSSMLHSTKIKTKAWSVELALVKSLCVSWLAGVRFGNPC